MDVSGLSNAQIIANCAQETVRFFAKQTSDSAFCYEMFRRAAQRDDHCTLAVLRQYQSIAEFWVTQHTGFPRTGETAEFFATTAITKVLLKLERDFDRFDSLNHIMQYLKMCAVTSVTQYLRDIGELPDLSIDDAAERIAAPSLLPTDVSVSEIWRRVEQVLENEMLIRLARCIYIWEMKPSEVLELYPDDWHDINTVYNAVRQIKRKLETDSMMRDWAGIE